ncbi:alpha/beta fold hydrolase [Microbacterium sp. A93]|uniref:alpha/beta fold hydrolase n=1 Tax=Microbacterium sp. A93 TaxID=3450716 RepID=UPI003F43863F
MTTAELAALKELHRHTTVGSGYRQESVAVPGGRMTVGVWGPTDPAAPTVLAVHGVSASHRSFGLLAEQLPEVRILAPDLRGRGRSNHLPGPFGMRSHAADMAAVIGELAAGPVTVIGHSMGAFVTLVLAHLHPDQVSSVVLVDGGIPLKVPAGLGADEIVQAVLGPVAERLAMRFGSVDEYRGFWQVHPALGMAWEQGPGADPGMRPLLEDYIAYDLEPGGPEDPPGTLRAATRYEAMAQDTQELQADGSLLAALEALAVPATLLWSARGLFNEQPGLYTAEYLTAWRQRVPALAAQLRSVQIPRTNHYTIVMSAAGAAAVAEVVRGDRD